MRPAPPFAVVIMAAGKGKRMMNPDMSKVMYRVGGRPMIDHVVRCAREAGAGRTIVVVGHQRQTVMDHLRTIDPSVEFAIQADQCGTGHAIMQTTDLLGDFDGDVVVLSGDVPLLRASTVREMIDHHRASHAVVTVLTALLPDPAGYGRVVRDGNGSILKIVEHKDATEEERLINEINSGIYAFRRKELFDALRHIRPDNAQGEYYLTDVFALFSEKKLRMEPFTVSSFSEIQGVNTKEQLDEMDRLYAARENR